MKTIFFGEAASDSGSFGFSDACPLSRLSVFHLCLPSKFSNEVFFILPSSPYRVNIHSLSNIDNQLNIGIVIIIGTTRDLATNHLFFSRRMLER
jgi:hypothetical protein